MVWFTKKKECVHCNKNKTKREFEDQPACAQCKIKILLSREPERVCPVDGTSMVKDHRNEIVIDRCPKCEGIWLDAGELTAIREAAQQEGMGAGIAAGMVIG